MLRLLSLKKNVKNLITSVLKSTTGTIAAHCAAIVWIRGCDINRTLANHAR